MKKIIALALLSFILISASLAELSADQEYVNKLEYQHNKLELVTKKRQIDEKRGYSYTDINTTSYSFEAYSQSYTDISTQSLQRAETKEISEWHILKGGVRELSDLEFLNLINDHLYLAQVKIQEDQKARLRNIGNLSIGTGILVMLAGAAASAGQSVIVTGAVTTTIGFFLDAFNQSPDHYIPADYALNKIDEYNLALKKKLDLPLNYQ